MFTVTDGKKIKSLDETTNMTVLDYRFKSYSVSEAPKSTLTLGMRIGEEDAQCAQSTVDKFTVHLKLAYNVKMNPTCHGGSLV